MSENGSPIKPSGNSSRWIWLAIFTCAHLVLWFCHHILLGSLNESAYFGVIPVFPLAAGFYLERGELAGRLQVVHTILGLQYGMWGYYIYSLQEFCEGPTTAGGVASLGRDKTIGEIFALVVVVAVSAVVIRLTVNALRIASRGDKDGRSAGSPGEGPSSHGGGAMGEEMGGGGGKERRPVIEIIQEDPPSGVFALLGLFLSVALSLSFFLAFHHRRFPDAMIFHGKTPMIHCGKMEGGRQPSGGTNGDLRWDIFFKESEIRVLKDLPLEDCMGRSSEKDGNGDLTAEKCHHRYACTPEKSISCFNFLNLEAATEQIRTASRDQRLQVRLVGHANDKEPKSGTNYEYSEARIIQVRHELESRLLGERQNHGSTGEPHGGEAAGEREETHGDDSEVGEMPANVEWVYIPVSTENLGGDIAQEDEWVGRSGLDPKLRVEILGMPIPSHVSVYEREFFRDRPATPARLLDYVYFMVYTTTTTGYGDIIPVTPVPKLVTIVGNLFEVLFLVVFLGTVISRCFVGSGAGHASREKPGGRPSTGAGGLEPGSDASASGGG